jgi:hypothetical protein
MILFDADHLSANVLPQSDTTDSIPRSRQDNAHRAATDFADELEIAQAFR